MSGGQSKGVSSEWGRLHLLWQFLETNDGKASQTNHEMSHRVRGASQPYGSTSYPPLKKMEPKHVPFVEWDCFCGGEGKFLNRKPQTVNPSLGLTRCF